MKDGLRCFGLALAVVACSAIVICSGAASAGFPPWTDFVQVGGQEEAIPSEWLRDPEARLAHALKVPDSVPKVVPFDFGAATRRSIWPGTQPVGVQYFLHLCNTEAGEWIFRKVDNVQGFYFARPMETPSGGAMTNAYGLEMPWIQRWFFLRQSDPMGQAGSFINPPFVNYQFIEQPRHEFEWQKSLAEPYVRLFGFTTQRVTDAKGNPTSYFREKTPMQFSGVSALSSRYGYTWRGLKRTNDREHGISGGEILVYDLQTGEVMAMRRQFLRSTPSRVGEGNAVWEIAARCSNVAPRHRITEFVDFVRDVLLTAEPSHDNK